MPVYNAAGTLRRALDSLLAQDYRHFDLLVSDNASTDDTEGICRAVARQDARVSYVRHDVNRGPVWNFNYVVGQARGRYFMRMSHDDIRSPQYLSKCVERLEANPRAVLCHSYTAAFYGEPSNVLSILTHDTLEGVVDPRERFLRALRHLPASAIDGVFRTEALRAHTRLMQPYLSSDIVLTHELSLYGEFVQVPEVLFWRSGKVILPPPQTVQRWSGQEAVVPRLKRPFVVLIENHLRSIGRSPLSAIDKAWLVARLLAHEAKVAAAKATFRVLTATFGARCPLWSLRWAIRVASDNPNVRILKPPRELPPVLHPTWRLLDHRDQEKALALQRELDERLYPARA